MESRKIRLLAGCIIVCFAAAFIGSVFTVSNIPTWYASIKKPELTPPNWVFGPVWTTLYILMGIALYLVLEKGWNEKTRLPVAVFAIQLALNTIWSILFFGYGLLFFAFIEIIVLWLSILATILLFNRVSRKAALLLVPYILWVSLASYLTYSVWVLN
ncbi:MAG: tryptophan-rich sensory protein [Candidatus Diapherotrites archaeon]|nr:tryptophan-rich sensory protein [Candidatus Diapherotrites archaeon]